MAGVRGRDTRPEMLLRTALHARGLRYRVHPKDVAGRPDIVHRGHQTAIFVDGDFWHGNPDEWKRRGFATLEDQFRGDQRDRWVRKLKRNLERDDEVNAALSSAGWRVLRVWESHVRLDAMQVAAWIEERWQPSPSGSVERFEPRTATD